MNSGNNLGRRTFLRAAGAGGVAASLAGCTGLTGGGGGGIPDTVKVGTLGPSEAPFGASIHNSVKLAAEEINNNGGIAGADVEVITKDTKDDPATARSGYQTLTTGENVHATLGIFGSEQLLAVMPNMAEQETVHLTAGAATPEAPRKLEENYEKFKYWFRVGPFNSTFLATSLIDFAKDNFSQMGWERIGIIVEDFKWTEPVSKIINERFADEVDVEVVYNKRIAEGTEDFTPIYDTLENKDVDGAYTSLAHIGTTSLVQWAKQKRPFGYGGIHVPTQLPSFYEATKGAAISTFSQTTATPKSEITDKTVPYAQAYNDKFDKYPVYNGYIAYDAMYLLKKKVEETESVDSDDLVSALEETSFTGASSPDIQFYGPDGEFPHDVIYGDPYKGIYFQWQADDQGNGVQEVVWPDEYATADYMQPPWSG